MNKQTIKQYAHTLLLLLGTGLLAGAASYLFIEAGNRVTNVLHIGLYVIGLFIVLPALTYVSISLYMWLLDRWLSDK
ncbi:hypothetical protein B5M42_019775 [Paenibacillus athensensis]|uniref:Uncharacterized protein n=1 Tax=Paenibacillus athensensis TaxID=1967502 RepID=A0A4Y8Q4B6_9BACL|nr:hypothetical protein [Paenibacillus athensensis]MCD1261047.1 hypothetical protein [Paenibacillus athensensis]